MLVTLENMLAPEQLQRARKLMADSSWLSGGATAGSQANTVRNNRQLPEDGVHLAELRHIALGALSRHPLFFSAALPLKILPPHFNRYGGDTNCYGQHVDGAMRLGPDGRGYVRADISATLFLSEPEEYDGGVLTIEDLYGNQAVKLRAGSVVIYPSTSVHEITPVTRGERFACFMFIQSMVRDSERRRILFDMDMALQTLRAQLGETSALVRLTGTYHNLLRQWADS